MPFVARRKAQASASRICKWQVLLIAMACLVTSGVSLGQGTADTTSTDKQTIQMLIQRVNQLEARVAALEGARQNPAGQGVTGEVPKAEVSGQVAPEVEQQTETSEKERMDVSKTLLRIRGFGDITLHGDNGRVTPGGQKDTTAFSLGQLNLFVTSDISENFKFLSEIVFEANSASQIPRSSNGQNIFGVDIERYLLQYSPNDYFNLAIGRYHTAIGYYNTAYHHSSWLQTATGRPFLFDFEDQGGILPIHNVGLSASGLIPSGGLGLHYVAELGNGRSWRHPLDNEPVQNEVDENTAKAFNLALFARPDAIRGLQVGFSGYHDHLTTPFGRMNETIIAGHFVFVRPKFEWLNEALVVRHTPDGTSRLFNTPGFYTQLSKQYGPYRPYFRYQYVNAPSDEPLFPDVGLRHGPSVGLRYDATESVALKLQYDYTALRQQPATSGVALQVGFTF